MNKSKNIAKLKARPWYHSGEDCGKPA